MLESSRRLPEEAEGYLLGRGMSEETIHRLGIGLWKTPAEPAPDKDFIERYKGGRYLDGRLVCPAWSPRGNLIGFEARAWRRGEGKRITDYRLPAAAWNPFFLGLTEETIEKLRAGGDVWIVEGLFDRVLELIVPTTDEVLATVRAKVSDAHVEFLRRWVRPPATVHIAYDNDETGRKQTHGWVDEKTGKPRWGAITRLEHVGVSVRDVPYVGGKDPCEIWEHTGTEGLRAAFAHVL